MHRRLLIGCLAGLLAAGFAAAQNDDDPPLPGAEVESAADAELVFADAGADELSILELLRRGGPLMYPLYLASLIMAAIGIERAVSLRRHKILPPDVVARVREVSAQRHGPMDVQRLLTEIAASETPLVRVVRAGLRKAYHPTAEIEKAIEDAGAKEAASMRRNCRLLSVVASVAPLLGLLGTVLGMIKAFMTVASSKEALGRTELLASGIYQALVTTATGLSIAIPALVLYYIFVDKVERLVTEMDDITIDLVERMSSIDDVAREA